MEINKNIGDTFHSYVMELCMMYRFNLAEKNVTEFERRLLFPYKWTPMDHSFNVSIHKEA